MKTHELPIYANSVTRKAEQSQVFSKVKGHIVYKCRVSWDDSCGNGYNSFSITCEERERGRMISGGCQHELIAEVFPELAYLIKWHCANSNAPMYYFENSQYYAKTGNLEYARKNAVWHDASLADILNDEKMLARLPGLMEQFKTDVESIGFIW